MLLRRALFLVAPRRRRNRWGSPRLPISSWCRITRRVCERENNPQGETQSHKASNKSAAASSCALCKGEMKKIKGFVIGRDASFGHTLQSTCMAAKPARHSQLRGTYELLRLAAQIGCRAAQSRGASSDPRGFATKGGKGIAIFRRSSNADRAAPTSTHPRNKIFAFLVPEEGLGG